MFVFYNETICLVKERFVLDNQYFYILLTPGESGVDKHYAKESECTKITIDVSNVDHANFYDMIEFLITEPYLSSNHYIKGLLRNVTEHYTLEWRFTYNGQRRRVSRIVKLFPDGFLADVGDDERRHFKWVKIEEDEGIVLH